MLCGLPTPGVDVACLLRGKPADDWPYQTLLGSWRSQGICLPWQRRRSRNTPICQDFAGLAWLDMYTTLGGAPSHITTLLIPAVCVEILLCLLNS